MRTPGRWTPEAAQSRDVKTQVFQRNANERTARNAETQEDGLEAAWSLRVWPHGKKFPRFGLLLLCLESFMVFVFFFTPDGRGEWWWYY